MRASSILMTAVRLTILATAIGQTQSPAPAVTPASAALVEGLRLLQQKNLDAARQQYERTIELARAEGNRVVEGTAYRGLAGVFSRQTKYPAAKESLERSLKILEGTGSQAEIAAALNDLGTVEYFLGNWDAARQNYLKALSVHEVLGQIGEQANLHRNLYFVTTDSEERLRILERGFTLAQQGGTVWLQGDILHAWSDALFGGGRLAESMAKLELAIERLESAGETGRGSLARALTSLGRLHRAHGHHDRALDAYSQAFRLQETFGDRLGAIQSMNAIGVAYQYLGQLGEARAWFERGLERARQTDSPLVTAVLARSLAGLLIETDPVRGIALLEDLVQQDPRDYDSHRILAEGYLELGRYAEAVQFATSALEKARAFGALDRTERAFGIRALAQEKLGHFEEAVTDAREAIALIERVRTDVISTDAMKRGFGEQHQYLFTLAIGLLTRLGRDREALDTAEQGRARAFADLLASRVSVSLKEPKADPLATRGGDVASPAGTLRLERDLRSLASASPLSSSDLVRLAAQLRSTIVSYWVAPEETYVWVVTPSGNVTGTRIPVTERRLAQLVDRTWAIAGAHAAGETDSTRTAPKSGNAPWVPRIRGEGLISLGNQAGIALRTLHGLLIDPIRPLLPAEAGSLLTVVPHGPLFRLSFAALQNPTGQYLVERHAIHYAPAGVVLQLAGQHIRPLGSGERRFLLVADPQMPPLLPNGKPLPRLPGTKREIAQVAALVPAASVISLAGAQATEARVRRLAGDRRVIHFATHGVIRADDPLSSFLALDAGSAPSARAGSRASTPASEDDGRLTASEIYALELNADLVVLSACRTGLGEVSGDGVVGLARAFLYAGTSSVVATLWDVADEPSALLMPKLYQSLRIQNDKARALRRAQIDVLKQLRAGQLSVATSSGSMILREHPVLWSGFILVGLP